MLSHDIYAMIKSVLHTLILLLAFSLPFEIIYPVLVLPWFQFTNLELLVVATLSLWLVHLLLVGIVAGRLIDRRWKFGWYALGGHLLVWFSLAFLSVAVLSAVLAPAHRVEALKFVTRLTIGLSVFAMVIHVVRSYHYLVTLMRALIIGAGISGLIGLGEAAGWRYTAPLMHLLKEAPTRVGGELRISASFQYATIAAMFFEMIMPLALAYAATSPIRLHRWMAVAVALLGVTNIVLTQSRAGMVTLAVVLATIVVLGWQQPRLRSLVPATLLSLGMLAAVTAALLWQVESFRTRLATENDLEWYGATYEVPQSLRLSADEPSIVTVAIHNDGTLQWHTTGGSPFALGYYWLSSGGQPLQKRHVEVPLPHAVAPGETVEVRVTLQPALSSGEYQLVWGMLQHNVLWFRHRNVPEVVTRVHVEKGAASSASPETGASIPGGEMPALPPTVGRWELWRAALAMWLDRPLLGVGPDNFRHLYGRYLELPDWDRRLHANNLYLELLAGWGIAGLLAFAGLMLLVGRHWLRLWRSATGDLAIWSVALGGSLVTFFVHGLLDYFLEFVSIYLLFWIVAALIVATKRMAVSGGGKG